MQGTMSGLLGSVVAVGLPALLPQMFISDPSLWPYMRSVGLQVRGRHEPLPEPKQPVLPGRDLWVPGHVRIAMRRIVLLRVRLSAGSRGMEGEVAWRPGCILCP
jgi:hypothetical protein